MTKTYAARRLLEHGPLTAPELIAITGWGSSTVWWAICRLEAEGLVRRFNVGGKTQIGLA